MVTTLAAGAGRAGFAPTGGAATRTVVLGLGVRAAGLTGFFPATRFAAIFEGFVGVLRVPFAAGFFSFAGTLFVLGFAAFALFLRAAGRVETFFAAAVFFPCAFAMQTLSREMDGAI